MKAIVNTNYGSVAVLQIKEIPKPLPKPNEVLIKIKATTVNRTDTGIRKAEYFIARFFTGFLKPKFHVLGSEFAGIIEARGSEVTNFKIGDEVFGLSGDTFGAHAEYLCFPEDGAIACKPQKFTFEESAAICEGHSLALNYLEKVNLGKGHKILINGGSGSIGSSAIQLAKYLGAEITAVTNTKNLSLAKNLGATQVIDYTTEDFTKINDKFDFIFDAVGKSSFSKCRPIMKDDAVYFSTELGFAYANVFLPLFTKRVIFPIPVHSKAQIEFFKTLAEAGLIRPVIDSRYSFDQIKAAHAYVELGQKTGSVVIPMD